VKRKPAQKKPGVVTLGWREWAALPNLGVRNIKVKLDTGARTSSLHAFRLRRYTRDGQEMVRFEVHPVQKSAAATVEVKAPVLEERRVRNSGGGVEVRPVIETTLELAGERWPIELTLTRRDEMGFRMLLGRQALRGRVLIDPAASFLGEREPTREPRPRREAARNKTRSQEEEE
jgi:hypothetical protein